MRLSRLGKRESLSDERLYLFLLEEVEQVDQVLSKPFRFPPFERLDAVTDHPSPAREQPAADDVPGDCGESTKALTTTWTTRSQSLSAQRGRMAIDHHPPAGTESLAGLPDVGAADGIKDDVHTVASKSVNLFHEVLML